MKKLARGQACRSTGARMLVLPLDDIDYLTELHADKGYDSIRNIMYVQSRGAVPYIAIK